MVPMLVLIFVTPLFLALPFFITRSRIAAARRDVALIPSTLRSLMIRAAILGTLVLYLVAQRNRMSAILAAWVAVHLGQVIIGLVQLRKLERR